jgi:hypothetical protein
MLGLQYVPSYLARERETSTKAACPKTYLKLLYLKTLSQVDSLEFFLVVIDHKFKR